ncbi:MAG: hypothetical protein ACP5J0_00890 [Pyrobaculum sp.]
MDDINEFISSQVLRYIEKKLGDAVKHVTIFVSYTGDGVEVDVDVDASVLVDDSYLQKVVDEAAELGVCIADLVKERGWPLNPRDAKKCWKS